MGRFFKMSHKTPAMFGRNGFIFRNAELPSFQMNIEKIALSAPLKSSGTRRDGFYEILPSLRYHHNANAYFNLRNE